MAASSSCAPSSERLAFRVPDFFRFALCLAATALALTASRALAQQQTTATYNDWTLRCTSGAGTPPQKFCDMEQVSQLKGKEQPFSRVAIARPAKGEPLRLIVQLPVNVAIAGGVKIELGKDAGLSGAFTRCLPAGCFAAVELKDDALRQFRAASQPARIVYANAAGQAVAVPLSFKGFGPAFDALQKQ